MTAVRAHHADLHHPTVTAGTLKVYCFRLGETLVLQVRTSSCSSSQPLKAQTKAAIRAHNLLHWVAAHLGRAKGSSPAMAHDLVLILTVGVGE